MSDLSRTYFELFELPERFQVDPARLDEAFRRAQSAVHPDRYAHAGDAEQRLALQLSAQVNEAYRTLKNPVSRASYLLGLHHVDAFDETDTAMPGDFLMLQMEWREELDDARGTRASDLLAALAFKVRSAADELDRRIAEAIDSQRAWGEARILVRQRKFLEKLSRDIADALGDMDD